MLVLNRKPGEEIHIDGDIIIKVLAVTNYATASDESFIQVRLGISAPKQTRVYRGELVIDRHAS